MLDATPLTRAWAARRLAALAVQEPVPTQRAVLRDLLRRAQSTRFGRAHGFEAIDGVAAFQRRVGIADHERFRREWWGAGPPPAGSTWPGRIPFLAETSGTTSGVTKLIPVSEAMLRANRRASLDLLAHHRAARPDSRLLAGPSLMLGGSTRLRRLPDGSRAGDLSGIAATTAPLWTRGRLLPRRDVALLGDWDRKIASIAATAPATLRSLSGTPSWLLLLFEALAIRRGTARRLAALFPALDLLVHGGTGIAPYRGGFARWLEGSRAETREAYAASEGFIAVADRGPEDGLRLVLDNGLFFEFVRPDTLADPAPDAGWIADAALDRDYALALSTNAGLWRYVVGDVVRLIARDPPRVVVTGRIAHTLNAFGEHVSAGELDRAVAAAAAAAGAVVRDYAAAPVFPDAAEPRGGHVFAVEAVPGAWDRRVFVETLDRALAAGNADYATHRRGDYGMRPPALRVLPPGSFERWMRARGRLGGQNKVPRVLPDAAALAALASPADPPDGA